MAVAIGLGVASLAAGIAGQMSSASAAASNAKAQHMQAEINRQWENFNKEFNLVQQRGAMGLAEMDRLYRNDLIARQSQEQFIASVRASRDAQQYATMQYSRQAQQMNAGLSSNLASRGMARGGTSEALQRQMQANQLADLERIRVNGDNQIAQYKNQRNAARQQMTYRQAQAPPAYIPSQPISPPNTDAMMTGALLGAIGTGLGGAAGLAGAMGSGTNTQAGYNDYLSATGGLSPSDVAAMSMLG